MSNDDEGEEEFRNLIRSIIKEEVGNTSYDIEVSKNSVKDVSIGEISRLASMAKGLKTAFESPVETALVKRMNEKIVEQVLPAMDSPPPQRGFLDTNFMTAVGSRLPEVLPTLIDVFITRLGKERTEELIDNFQDKLIGAGSNGGNKSNKSGEQNVVEFILSLNPDDPADLHRFMSVIKIEDMNMARKILVEKKKEIMLKSQDQKSGLSGVSAGNVLESKIEEQNLMLNQLISVIEEDREQIGLLRNEINKLKVSTKDIDEVTKGVIDEDVTEDIIEEKENAEIAEINDDVSCEFS